MELGKSQLRVCDSNYAIHFTVRKQRVQEMSLRENFKKYTKWWYKVRKEKSLGNMGTFKRESQKYRESEGQKKGAGKRDRVRLKGE